MGCGSPRSGLGPQSPQFGLTNGRASVLSAGPHPSRNLHRRGLAPGHRENPPRPGRRKLRQLLSVRILTLDPGTHLHELRITRSRPVEAWLRQNPAAPLPDNGFSALECSRPFPPGLRACSAPGRRPASAPWPDWPRPFSERRWNGFEPDCGLSVSLAGTADLLLLSPKLGPSWRWSWCSSSH